MGNFTLKIKSVDNCESYLTKQLKCHQCKGMDEILHPTEKHWK